MAIRLGQEPADDKRTFGYKRFEVLAAAFNAVLFFGVAIYVLVQAVQRFRETEGARTNGALIVAALATIGEPMRRLMDGVRGRCATLQLTLSSPTRR